MLLRNFLVLLLSCVGSLAAQPQIISVYDEVTIRPLSGAGVELLGVANQSLQRGVTDDKGKMILTVDTAGIVSIRISHNAYEELLLPWDEVRKAGFRLYVQSKSFDSDEVIFTANKFREQKSDIPYQITVVKAMDIQFANPQTTADLLEKQGTIFVQKSQMGGGSPILRGFEANKVMIVIDGIRINNAIYRSGHLQNVITIDPRALERTEVLFGPSSTMYGSDALGGVMHFYTKKPTLSRSEKPEYEFNASTRYGSVNSELNAHIDFDLGFKRWGLFTSVTASDFKDLTVGDWRRSAWGDSFGIRPFYVERIAGRDSMVANDNPNKMAPTGYTQYDFLQKFLFLQGDNITHQINLQYSISDDIPRFDRLSQYADDSTLKYAEWYYGPQDRLLGAYTFTHFGSKAWDELRATLSFQNIIESRNRRRYRNDELTSNVENVGIVSLNVDALKEGAGGHEMAYGLEVVYNRVRSTAETKNIVTGEIGPAVTRYPAGGSNMEFLAAYYSHRWEATPKATWSAGIRLTGIGLGADFGSDGLFPVPTEKISRLNGALSGNLGLVYRPAEGWRTVVHLATGFRAPNVDDLAKVFDPPSGTLLVPNPELQPEYTYSGELTLGKKWEEAAQIELTGYYTYYDNAIVLRDYQLNGQDSILWDGEWKQIQANVNARKAFITGFSFSFTGKMGSLGYFAMLNWTYGRDMEADAPMDHIPPLFGKLGLDYRIKRFRAELVFRFNGAKGLDRYSPRDLDNIQFATPDGSPGWWVLDINSSYAVTENFRFQIGMDNILDQHYRTYSSRISAGGRNFWFALQAGF